MNIPEDMHSAKRALSNRLLRRGLQFGIVGRLPSIRVHSATAMSGHNVHAVGVGRKEVAGELTEDICIRVHVLQKLGSSLLAPRDAVPATVEGIPTDVIESPPAFILPAKTKMGSRAKKKQPSRSASSACSVNRKNRQRPIVAGISAAHYNVTAGTIAYFCKSDDEGDDPSSTYILSNNHVFADVNQASAGDDLYQPGPADNGAPQDHMADLARFVPIQLGGTTPNKVDGAIGKLRPDASFSPEICMIGALDGHEAATVGTEVRKHGRTTGYTEGEVSDDAYDALVGMDHSDPTVVGLFEDQFRIAVSAPYPAFGLGGDSGSMVVHRDRAKAVGLYFAGPSSGVYGVANHIDDVLTELAIRLV